MLFWLGMVVLLGWVFRVDLILEPKRLPLTDGDIWAFMEGKR